MSADSEVELEKETALREIVEGLAESGAPEEYDAVQVQGHKDRRALIRAIDQGQAKVRGTKSGAVQLVADEPESSFLAVSTDAKEHHPVDGVPIIPGDGQSFLTITLRKMDRQGKQLTRKGQDGDVIWLRTSHGTLREDRDDGLKSLRSVTLAGGTASFRLYSENGSRMATIELLTTNPNLRTGSFRVEFVEA